MIKLKVLTKKERGIKKKKEKEKKREKERERKRKNSYWLAVALSSSGDDTEQSALPFSSSLFTIS